MDYHVLANELLRKIYVINKDRPQRKLNECMRGEGFVLQYVIFHEGPVQPNEISSFMNISTARIAAALNSLERKGFVTRRIDPSDRRRILVELTPEGKELADAQRGAMLNHMIRMLERLGEQDSTELVRILGRVAEITNELHKNPDGQEENAMDDLFTQGRHPWHRH